MAVTTFAVCFLFKRHLPLRAAWGEGWGDRIRGASPPPSCNSQQVHPPIQSPSLTLKGFSVQPLSKHRFVLHFAFSLHNEFRLCRGRQTGPGPHFRAKFHTPNGSCVNRAWGAVPLLWLLILFLLRDLVARSMLIPLLLRPKERGELHPTP